MKKLLSLIIAAAVMLCMSVSSYAALLTRPVTVEPYTAVVNSVGGYIILNGTDDAVWIPYGSKINVTGEYKTADGTEYVKGTYEGKNVEVQKSYVVKEEDFKPLSKEELSSIIAENEKNPDSDLSLPDITTSPTTTTRRRLIDNIRQSTTTTKPSATETTTQEPETTTAVTTTLAPSTTAKATTTTTVKATTTTTTLPAETETETEEILLDETEEITSFSLEETETESETEILTTSEETTEAPVKNMKGVITAGAAGLLILAAVAGVCVFFIKRRKM
ncbi:MAG: hypothetical protein IKY00_04065 [Clostridia bacterium]|nr:hypothetical protein [Clostridia bacterium]